MALKKQLFLLSMFGMMVLLGGVNTIAEPLGVSAKAFVNILEAPVAMKVQADELQLESDFMVTTPKQTYVYIDQNASAVQVAVSYE